MRMIDMVREELKKLEAQVKEAEDLLNRLKLAGEDVTQQMVKLTQLKQKLERYKKAFS
jgi:uncharacterized protein involved in exopolysaccharide biosynthesis